MFWPGPRIPDDERSEGDLNESEEDVEVPASLDGKDHDYGVDDAKCDVEPAIEYGAQDE